MSRRRKKPPEAPAAVQVAGEAAVAGLTEIAKAAALQFGPWAVVATVIGMTTFKGFAQRSFGAMHARLRDLFARMTVGYVPELLEPGIKRKRARQVVDDAERRVEKSEKRRAQMDEVIRRLLDLPDPVAAETLGRLARLVDDGATPAFKAVALLVSRLSAAQVADLDRVSHLCGPPTQAEQDDHAEQVAQLWAVPDRSGRVILWRMDDQEVQRNQSARKVTLTGVPEELFEAMRAAGLAIEPPPRHDMSMVAQAGVAIRADAAAILVRLFVEPHAAP
jgi:hypothetical protein